MEAVGFEELAGRPDPPLDAFALAMAAEFGEVAWLEAGQRLGQLGRELADCLSDAPRAPHRESAACRIVLCERAGFRGNKSDYGDPRNSMLDQVLDRRAGLPITLSVLWVEVARRAEVELAGVGLPGHFVVGHFGAVPPLLLDPFNGGELLGSEQPSSFVRPWRPHDIVMRMLNNLLNSYVQRGDLTRALRAADLRMMLPSGAELRRQMTAERAGLLARLN